MSTAAVEAAVNYVARLPTADRRREATSVLRSDLLAAISALTGCQRCGFVEQVLAAFNPELAASARAAQRPDLWAGAWLAASSSTAIGPDVASDPGSGPLRSARDVSHHQGQPSSMLSAVYDTANRLADASTDIASSGLMTPTQILSLLSDRGGASTLVGLLQFNWMGLDCASLGSQDGGSDGDNGASRGGRHDSRLALCDSLLSRPRLLRQFLEESVMVMQDLNDDVGDCRRHSGYPGPTELASTLARLETQRCHTLQRLAAFGVLRTPPQPGLPMDASTGALVPGGLRLVEQPQAAADGQACQGYGDRDLEHSVGSDADEADPQLGLASAVINLRDPSIAVGAASPSPMASPTALTCTRLPPLSPAPPLSALSGSCDVTVSGHGPGSRQRHHKQPAPQSPRRSQRTPPRPTAAGAGAWASASAQGGVSPFTLSRGPEAVRSTPGSADGSLAGDRAGLSEGDRRKVAVAGAAVLGQVSSLEAMARSVTAHPNAASQQPDGGRRDQGLLMSPSPPLPMTSPRASAAAVQEPSRGAEGGSNNPQQQPMVPESQEAAAPRGVVPSSPLSVSAVVAAAEGLADATVLVDAAAVAAVSDGLRERVQHLVAQLVQVQQRRSRLEHACQHGILAAGRKLLLILLQLLWTSLRRAAAAAGVSVTPATAAEASPPSAADAYAAAVAAQPAADTQAEAASPEPSPAVRATPERSPPVATRPASRHRLPRYEGLLADLAAGLEEDDTHLEVAMDFAAYGSGLSIALEQAAGLDDPCPGGLSRASRSWRNRAGTGSGAMTDAGRMSHGAVGLGPWHGASNGDWGSAQDDGRDGAGGGDEGWDAALAISGAGTGGGRAGSSSNRGEVGRASVSPSLAGAVPLRRSAAPPSPSSSSAVGRQAIGWGTTPLSLRPTEELRGSMARVAAAPGGLGLEAAAGGRPGAGWKVAADPHRDDSGWLDDSGACQPGCIAAREQQQQAEQLRVLQGQLLRCQISQTELQAEVGRLLDLLAEQRRVQDQATAALRRDLAHWQADPAVLQGLGTEELGELAAKMEAALNRVRSAQLQAAAERDMMCPVCWERRKGLVFGCGHQTCCACGERLAACPICREPVSLRIRVYG